MTGADDGRDDGAERETRPEKPCSFRMGNSRWCVLPPDHTGDHDAPPAREIAPNDLSKGRKRV